MIKGYLIRSLYNYIMMNIIVNNTVIYLDLCCKEK